MTRTKEGHGYTHTIGGGGRMGNRLRGDKRRVILQLWAYHDVYFMKKSCTANQSTVGDWSPAQNWVWKDKRDSYKSPFSKAMSNFKQFIYTGLAKRDIKSNKVTHSEPSLVKYRHKTPVVKKKAQVENSCWCRQRVKPLMKCRNIPI